MSLSYFGEKIIVPNEETLAGALSGSKAIWDDIKSHVASVCGGLREQWKYYSKKAGWSLVVKSGERTILYLIPQETFFKVNFVLGDKAVATALAAGLPEHIIALINESVPYMEGRSLMFDVKTEADADVAKKLIEVKHAN